MSFEEQLRRLEHIVETLDRGSEPLEHLMTLYQEAMVLSKSCREYLESAEQKIVEIKAKNNFSQKKFSTAQEEEVEEIEGDLLGEDVPEEKNIPKKIHSRQKNNFSDDEEIELPF